MTSRGAWRWLSDQPVLLLVLTTLCWAGNAVAGRMAVGEVSPMVVTCLRWFVVVAVLAVVARRDVVASWSVLARHWVLILAMGIFGFTAFNAIFYEAAHYTTAVNIGVIQGTMPAMVLLGSFAVYRTPVSALQLAGLALTLIGVAVVASRGELDVLRRLDFNIGDLAMVFASILYAGYTVFLRRRPPVPPLAFFAAIAAAAFLSSAPLLGLEIAAGRSLWPTPTGWALIVFIGLFASLVSQLMFMRGVELIGPGRAGLFVNLVPVFAAVLGVAILRETFAPYHAVALTLVLGGIGIAEWGKRDAGSA